MKAFLYTVFSLVSITVAAEDFKAIAREEINSHEHYGWAMDMSDDYLVVGSPHSTTSAGEDAGKVHIYMNMNGEWKETQELTDPNGAAFENFGYSVSIYNDWLAVGAVGSFYAGPFTGIVLLYHLENGTWTLNRTVVSPLEDANQWFGHSVALNATYLAVGAIKANGSNPSSGNVFVYANYRTGITDSSSVVSAEIKTNDQYGFSVALNENNLLVVGAPDHKVNDISSAGAVYTFSKQSSSWQLNDILVSSEANVSDHFGSSISLDEAHLVVGAYLGDGAVSNSGDLYVYGINDINFNLEQEIHPGDGKLNDYFGQKVLLKDSVLLVSAPKADIDTLKDAGKVYQYEKQDGAWTLVQTYTENTPSAYNHYGYGIAMSQNYLSISSQLSDELETDAGMVYAKTYNSLDFAMIENISKVSAAPNPVQEHTSIQFYLYNPSKVSLQITDANGRIIKELLNEQTYSIGTHNVNWDKSNATGAPVATGTYFYQLSYDKNTYSGKLIVK